MLADKLNVFVPVWRRSTGNRFMGPHYRPGDRGTRLDAGTGSPNATFMGVHLASMQQAMHLSPRSQLVGWYIKQPLYGQPRSSLWRS